MGEKRDNKDFHTSMSEHRVDEIFSSLIETVDTLSQTPALQNKWRDGAPDGFKSAFSDIHLLMLLISVTLPQEQYYEQEKDPQFFFSYYISWLMRKWTITWGTTWRVGAVFSPADLSGEKPVGCKWWNWSLSCHVNGRRQLCQNKEMNDSGNTVLVEVLFFFFQQSQDYEEL